MEKERILVWVESAVKKLKEQQQQHREWGGLKHIWMKNIWTSTSLQKNRLETKQNEYRALWQIDGRTKEQKRTGGRIGVQKDVRGQKYKMRG